MKKITHFLNVPILDYSHRFLLKMPYKLGVGDQLYVTSKEHFGKLIGEDEVDIEFESMLDEHCYFLVEEICVNVFTKYIEVKLKPL
mgnify:CR=1 FL=1|tara:strand:- start:188 stop:445 length:258 start_codon:yes stop_codon:yes gene_type:complete